MVSALPLPVLPRERVGSSPVFRKRVAAIFPDDDDSYYSPDSYYMYPRGSVSRAKMASCSSYVYVKIEGTYFLFVPFSSFLMIQRKPSRIELKPHDKEEVRYEKKNLMPVREWLLCPTHATVASSSTPCSCSRHGGTRKSRPRKSSGQGSLARVVTESQPRRSESESSPRPRSK